EDVPPAEFPMTGGQFLFLAVHEQALSRKVPFLAVYRNVVTESPSPSRRCTRRRRLAARFPIICLRASAVVRLAAGAFVVRRARDPAIRRAALARLVLHLVLAVLARAMSLASWGSTRCARFPPDSKRSLCFHSKLCKLSSKRAS